MLPARSTGDFGAALRGARERRGVSLREIAKATKISVAALGALERNDVARLPGGIFSRAFVRSYAAEVGLDPEQTVREFIAAFPEQPVATGQPAAPVEDRQAVESDRRIASTVLQLIALSVAGAVGVWLFAASGQRPPAPTAPGANAEPAAAPTAHASDLPPVRQSAAVAATNAEPAAAPPPEATASPRFTVRLAVTRPCWISLTVDGRKTIERILHPGDERTLDVEREIVFTAGDAGAVALTINGAEARPIGRAGMVSTARINTSNVRDYLRVPPP